MLETIIELLKEAGTDGWEVTDTKTEGWEFYFIRHQLDQNRVRNVEHINVSVYKKFDSFLGKASTEIPVSASREEAADLIKKLCAEALLVKNPVYSLNMPAEVSAETQTMPDVRAIAKDFLTVMNELPESGTADINSYELFISAKEVRFMNSNGIDVTSIYPSSMAEVVVNARNEKHEIELYRLYHSGSCDKEGLKQEISETLKYGTDRLSAQNTPNLGTCDVVFSTDASLQIYEFFIDRMNTGMKYRQLSSWEPGKPVCEDVKGDRITVKALRSLANSSSNSAYDAEGAPIRDLVLINNGMAEHWWGSRQFSQYMGVEDSFSPGNFAAEGGTRSAEELRQGTFLEIVEFSDFQVETMTGAIAGEIRLGYYHNNGTVTVVTGGSVSGTMMDFMKEMYMSREQKQYNNMLVPAVTRLKGVSITGAAD